MSPKRAESLAWILIYSGMLLAALGWFVGDQGSLIGPVLMVVGAMDACIGVGLIWWRSRQNGQNDKFDKD